MDCPSTLHNSKKCKTGTPITILPVPDSILRTTETTSKNLRKEKLEWEFQVIWKYNFQNLLTID